MLLWGISKLLGLHSSMKRIYQYTKHGDIAKLEQAIQEKPRLLNEPGFCLLLFKVAAESRNSIAISQVLFAHGATLKRIHTIWY